MYPYKKSAFGVMSSKINKFFKNVSTFSYESFASSDNFSPVRLYMEGIITSNEYKDISKYSINKLRIYHAPSTPLHVKVILRQSFKIFGKMIKTII